MNEHSGHDLAIVDVALIDGTGGEPVDAATVVVRDGRIERVGSGSPPAGLPVVDGAGHTLIPGLFDCHIHLSLTGGANCDPDPEPDTFAVLRAARDAHRTLAAGFTTVRDTGGRDFMEMTLRDAIRRGIVRGPRLVLAGKIVSMTTPGCRWYPGMYREADGADEVRKAAREQLKMGADLVKLMATAAAFAPDEDPESVQYELEELRAAVEEAHKQNRHVAAHAEGVDGIRNAVHAGVDTIEHGDCLYQDEELMARMRQQGTHLVPTLTLYEEVMTRPEEPMPEFIRRNVARMHEANIRSFTRAVELEVPIAMGTDAGASFNPHGGNATELSLMVRYGMTPVQAISASTLGPARALRLDSELGTVEPGKLADLVLVAGDLGSDIELLRRPENVSAVVQRGEIVVDRRAGAAKPELNALLGS